MNLSRMVNYLLVLVVCITTGCATLAPVTTTAELIYNRHEIGNYFNKLHHSNIIEKRIAKSGLNKDNRIHISETDNAILAYGQVHSDTEKMLVNQILQEENNGKNLFNELEIREPISFTQRARDTWATANLKSRFILENAANLTKIKVITDDNIIFLFGDNLRPIEAAHAVELARATPYAKKVVKIFGGERS